jgi:hypothetical protein
VTLDFSWLRLVGASMMLPLLASCTTGSQVTGHAVDPRPFGDVNTVPFGEAAKATPEQAISDEAYHVDVETLMAEATSLNEKGRILWEATFKEPRTSKATSTNAKRET